MQLTPRLCKYASLVRYSISRGLPHMGSATLKDTFLAYTNDWNPVDVWNLSYNNFLGPFSWDSSIV